MSNLPLSESTIFNALVDRVSALEATGGSPGIGLGLNVKDAPYNASGSAATTTGSISSGSNALTVANASTFAVGQGVFVEGAGSQGTGDDLVKTITAIAGSVLTLSGNASATVSGAAVMHDDTDAIQAAIDSLFAADAGGGWLFLPAGEYRVNKGFSQTLTDGTNAVNSILYTPFFDATLATGDPLRFFGMRGEFMTRTIWQPVAAFGTIISTILSGSGTGPSIISARSALVGTVATWDTGFNCLAGEIDSIRFQIKHNTVITAVDAGHFMNFKGRVVCETDEQPLTASVPTNRSTGVVMPLGSNNVKTEIECYVIGYSEGLRISEHNYIHPHSVFYHCVDAIVPNLGGHPNIGACSIEHCKRWINNTDGAESTINLVIRSEKTFTSPWDSVPGLDIYDPLDKMHGLIDFKCAVAGPGSNDVETPSIVGCSNVQFRNMWKPYTTYRLAPAATTGTVEDSFAGTDGDVVEGRTPNVTSNGGTWHSSSGGFEINTNALRSIGLGTNVLEHEIGSANMRVSATYKSGGADAAGAGLGVVVRYKDAANFLYVYKTGFSFQLFGYIAGGLAQIGSDITHSGLSAADVIAIEASGTTITLKLNGSSLGSWTSVSNFSTETAGGIRAVVPDIFIDNLKIEGI